MNSLRSRIASHFQSGSNEPILRLIARDCSGTETDVLSLVREVFQSESPVLAKFLLKQLQALGRQSFVAEVAMNSWPPRGFAWSAISALIDIELSDAQNRRRVEWARRLLDSDSEKLQVANARLIFTQIPELKPDLIRCVTPVTQRTIFVFAAQGDLSPLISALADNGHESLPTVLGLALTAQWLAQQSLDSATIAELLAFRHGYVADISLQQAIPFLEAGIRHVNSSMVEKCVEEVQGDLAALNGVLVRGINGIWSNLKHSAINRIFDFAGSDYDLGLLFAAVRDLDTANLEQRRRDSPFDFMSCRDVATDVVRFMHVPVSLLRQSLFDDAVKRAHYCCVPDSMLNQFIFEWVVTQLGPTDIARLESELFLCSRWTAMSALNNWDIADFQTEHLGQTIRFPVAMSIVVPHDRLDFSFEQSRPRLKRTNFPALLSPCATAVARFAEVYLCGERLREVYDKFETSEAVHSRHLCPVGIEVQIPMVDDNRHIAWKELFRSVGIPSRRRPECGRMLEASLPQAASMLPVVAFLRMLIEFNIITHRQDVGIHMSLQGNLAESARYLAYPQLFLNRAICKTPRSRDSMRLVMSKGLVNRDTEVRKCSWYPGDLIRTELRVFVAGIESINGSLVVDECLIDALNSTHLIASALLARSKALQDVGRRYIQDIRNCVNRFPEEFGRLLSANFYEATGDFHDPSLLEFLPILEHLEIVKRVSSPDLIEQLGNELGSIRKSAANEVLMLLPIAPGS